MRDNNTQPYETGKSVKLRTPIYPELRNNGKYSNSVSKGSMLQSQQFNEGGIKKRPMSRVLKQPNPSSKYNTKIPSAHPTEETELHK